MGPLHVISREVLVTPLNKKEVGGLGAEEDEERKCYEESVYTLWFTVNSS